MNQRFASELRRVTVMFLYLALIIGGFRIYRTLILEEYHMGYFQYGYALVESLILTKIILLGDFLRLGETFNQRPLIVPTLYKAVSFSILVLVFESIEHLIPGLIHGKDLASVLKGMFTGQGLYEQLAQFVMMFVALVPFFALRGINSALGEGKLFALFFENRVG